MTVVVEGDGTAFARGSLRLFGRDGHLGGPGAAGVLQQLIPDGPGGSVKDPVHFGQETWVDGRGIGLLIHFLSRVAGHPASPVFGFPV